MQRPSLRRGSCVGVTLSGGGTRMYGHLGVLEALEDKQMRIEEVFGVSGGAIVGAAYAALGYEQARALLLQYPIARAMRFGWLRNGGWYDNRDIARLAREQGVTWEAVAARGIDLKIGVTALETGISLVWTKENHPVGVDLAEAMRISASIPFIWGYTRMPTSMIDWQGKLPEDASVPPVITLTDGGASDLMLPGEDLPWVASNVAFNGYRTYPVTGLFDLAVQIISTLQYRAMAPALTGASCLVKHRRMRALGWVDQPTPEGIASMIAQARAEAEEELARVMTGP